MCWEVLRSAHRARAAECQATVLSRLKKTGRRAVGRVRVGRNRCGIARTRVARRFPLQARSPKAGALQTCIALPIAAETSI